MKSEPSELSIDDLRSQKRAPWDGVRNYTARNYMRDQMVIGDLVIFYHSSCDAPGPAGMAKIATLPYPDHTQFNSKSKYFDPKASRKQPRWFMVDVEFVSSFPRNITREEMKGNRALDGLILWTQNRLSITPMTQMEFDMIVKMSK